MSSYKKPYRQWRPYIKAKPTVPPLAPLNATAEQAGIIASAREMIPESNIVVKSGAGTGKTTTGIHMMANSPEQSDCACIAFARRNKEDFERRFSDPRWMIKTITGFGFLFLMRAWGTLRLSFDADKNKLFQACPELKEEKQAMYMAGKLLSYVQSTCVGIPTQDKLMKIATARDFECDQKRQALGWKTERLCEIVSKALTLAMVKPIDNGVSYGDMNWTAVACGFVKPSFNCILRDEWQDANELSNELCRMALRPNGRKMTLGDDNQAIYGFRGALFGEMKRQAEMPGAIVHKLSQTFRCGKAIVRQANLLVPDYYAHESNHEGEVLHGASMEEEAKTAVPGEDAYLSRTNAPLMKHCLGFIAKGKPANVEGKDIGDDLIYKVETVAQGTHDIASFLSKLTDWQAAGQAKASGWNAAEKIARIQDDTETMRVLAESSQSVSNMTDKIRDLFTDADKRRKPVIVLSTVHKAKGLEWDRVGVLTETFQSGRASTPEAQQEESNIQYVAWTRPKHRLAFVV